MNKWVRSTGGKMLTGENRRTGRAACRSLTWSTESITQTGLELIPGLRGDRTPTDRLSHRTVVASVHTKQFRRGPFWSGVTLSRKWPAAGKLQLVYLECCKSYCLRVLLTCCEQNGPSQLPSFVSIYLPFSEQTGYTGLSICRQMGTVTNQIAILCERKSWRSCVKHKGFFSLAAEGVALCTEHNYIINILNT